MKISQFTGETEEEIDLLEESERKKSRKNSAQLTCEVCQKIFASKQSLENHLKLHKDQRPFSCPKCPKSFVNETILNTHQLKVHKDPKVLGQKIPKNFDCVHCGKILNCAANLRVCCYVQLNLYSMVHFRSILAHFWSTLRPFYAHFMSILCPIKVHFRFILGPI